MTGCSPSEYKTSQLRSPRWENWDRKHCFLPLQHTFDFSVDPANFLAHPASCPTHSRVTSTSTPLWKMPFFHTLAATPLMVQEHVHPALTDKEKNTKQKHSEKQKDAHSHEGFRLKGYSLRNSGMREEGAKARVLHLGGSTLLCPGTPSHNTPVQHGRQI